MQETEAKEEAAEETTQVKAENTSGQKEQSPTQLADDEQTFEFRQEAMSFRTDSTDASFSKYLDTK